MKKSDLILALSEREGLREPEAFEIVNLVFSGFTDALRKGERIEITRIREFYGSRLSSLSWEKSENREARQGRPEEIALLQGREGIEGRGQ